MLCTEWNTYMLIVFGGRASSRILADTDGFPLFVHVADFTSFAVEVPTWV